MAAKSGPHHAGLGAGADGQHTRRRRFHSRGVNRLHGVRGRISHLKRLADAQALDGNSDDPLSTIEEALQANPEELVFRPNILAYRGELRFKQKQSKLAESDFREAIALAQKDAREGVGTARNDKPRAAAARHEPGRTMLAEIYSWFTEGFDTADLKDAKALLDELIL
jgi:Flp pilus assembly protein TadD